VKEARRLRPYFDPIKSGHCRWEKFDGRSLSKRTYFEWVHVFWVTSSLLLYDAMESLMRMILNCTRLVVLYGIFVAWTSPNSVLVAGNHEARQRQEFIPTAKQVRVIISSDAANEADDQAAIAYALLSPKLVVRGIVASHFKPHTGSLAGSERDSTEASYHEIQNLLKVMKLGNCVPVFIGAKRKFANANESLNSEGSDFIVREALADDSRPLFVLVLGPLTDLATAFSKDQSIAQRLTAVWIGGAGYPQGGPEYNQDGDRIAADKVMKSSVPLWQLPLNVYLMPRFGLIEGVERIATQGLLGGFLFERLDRFRRSYQVGNEVLLYADLPAVGVLLFSLGREPDTLTDFKSEWKTAPSVLEDGSYDMIDGTRKIRVFLSLDQRAVLEDFFAKLAAYKRRVLAPNCSTRTALKRESVGTIPYNH
jgi:hypothetical protein